MMYLARPVVPCPAWPGAGCVWEQPKVKHVRPHHGKRLLAAAPAHVPPSAGGVAASGDRPFCDGWRACTNRLTG